MKARIKGTNEIVECLEIGLWGDKSKGIRCKYSNGSYEVIPGDSLIEIEDTFDWQSFRNQAAKDILCAMLGNKRNTDFCPDKIGFSIKYADELIKQLKEKEEK